MWNLKVYSVFQLVQRYLERLVIMNVFQHGNKKDCLMKVLNLLLHLIAIFPKCWIILALIWGKLDGSCIKEDKVTYTHETVVSIYMM